MSIRNDASFQVSLKLQSTSQPVSTLAPRSYFYEAFYSGVAAVVMSGMSTLLRNTRLEMFPSVAPQSWDTEVSVLVFVRTGLIGL